jgi:hypothetical protein
MVNWEAAGLRQMECELDASGREYIISVRDGVVK